MFEPGAGAGHERRLIDQIVFEEFRLASGECGRIDEVQSPDDNLQAVFKYLVKQ